MAIKRETVTITTTGSAGSATGSGVTSKIVDGVILAVYLNYTSQPATTDVVIEEANNSPALPVLTKSNYNTDGWLYPRTTLQKVSDGSDLTGPVDYQTVSDYLSIEVTGGDAVASGVAVTIVWDDGES